MGTTVDLPPAVHPVVTGTDDRSGFPVISVGRRITSERVAAALDEE